MDKGKKEVLDFLSTTLDTEYDFKTIGSCVWDAEHYYAVNIPRDYDHYTVKDFIVLFQIDCLLEKGLITENDHGCLVRLFYQKKDLYARIGRPGSDTEKLSAKIDLIDEIFAKYNIGDIDLASMIYNNAIVKDSFDLQQEIIRRKI